MLTYLIVLLSGISIYLLTVSVVKPSGKQIVRSRISKYLKTEAPPEIQEQVLREKLEKAKNKKNQKFQIASKEFSDYLLMSGIKLRASEFIYIWIAITFVPMLIINLAGGSVITAIALAVIGFAFPPFFVQRARKKRQNEFNKQLSESLVIMSNCIKAGFSFQQAMESIAHDMQPPISTEFAKVLREIRFGVSKNDALRHMVERVKNNDFALLVSAVITSDQVGGNLSDILDIIAGTIRDRIRIKQEIRVLTAQGRISGIIIGLMPVFLILLLMVINPGYFTSFFENSIGKIMLGVSLLMEIMGFVIINKIVDIKY